ncbi:MAG: hypothetical protein RLZZ507_3718 [Cyanobacteriota bacterium]|jgi:hypothetical protein
MNSLILKWLFNKSFLGTDKAIYSQFSGLLVQQNNNNKSGLTFAATGIFTAYRRCR